MKPLIRNVVSSLAALVMAACAGGQSGPTPTLEFEPTADEMAALGDDMKAGMSATQQSSAAFYGSPKVNPEVQIQYKWGGRLVTLSGDPAKELLAAMTTSSAFTTDYSQGGVAVWGQYTVCVADANDAQCNLWVAPGYPAKLLSEADSDLWSFIFQGRRFNSAATEVFLALTSAQNLSPTVTAVEGKRLACQKTTYTLLCGVTRPKPTPQLELTFTGLPMLGPDYVYEGWLITSDGPVSTGRFTVDASKRFVSEIDPAVAADSTVFVLTIEPAVGDDPAPAATHILAGEFGANGAAELSIAHGAALGTDFQDAAGSFILETPSSAETEDYDQGVWFIDPSIPGASLQLPTLPEGWAYEGWVVGENGPVSTGRFTDPAAADSDTGGPSAGPLGTPPFPGQDFIDPAMVLVGGAVVVSVEPEPDDSPLPFVLKPLIDMAVLDVGPAVTQPLVNIAANNAPSGVAILREPADDRGEMWIANRVGKTISVIDVQTELVVATLPMPDAGEPMYVNQVDDRVFVGDRAANGVVVFDADTYLVEATVPTGAGVFHQWALADGDQLWVNNDIDKTTTVIDTASLAVLATVPMPADLVALPGAGKPHDVLVDPKSKAAFVSYLGFDGNDWVVRFSTKSFAETARAEVGKDPHLSATGNNNLLYVPCQETDEVVVLKRNNLKETGRVALPGAHGIGMAPNGRTAYITNLPGAGEMALFALSTETNALLATDGVAAPQVGVPHNVAVDGDGRHVYVTHSGATSSLVSIYAVDDDGQRVPTGVTSTVNVGLNPFGLGFVAP